MPGGINMGDDRRRDGDPVSAPQFTPGPWSVGPAGVIASRRPYETETGTGRITEWVAECIGQPRSFDESVANANLIAAAPELYEALTEVANFLRHAECVTSDYRAVVGNIVNAALAKALGNGSGQ